MAEFCLDCWNKMNNSSLTNIDVKISKYLDLCEGCGEIKNVIIFYEKFGTIKNICRKIFRR
jgi:hypothetical protein